MTFDRDTARKMLEVEQAMLAMQRPTGEFSCGATRTAIENRITRLSALLDRAGEEVVFRTRQGPVSNTLRIRQIEPGMASVYQALLRLPLRPNRPVPSSARFEPRHGVEVGDVIYRSGGLSVYLGWDHADQMFLAQELDEDGRPRIRWHGEPDRRVEQLVDTSGRPVTVVAQRPNEQGSPAGRRGRRIRL